MNQFDRPFYRPLWIRVLIVLVCFGWGLMELLNGTYFWTVLVWGIGAYAGYRLFITFNPDGDGGQT
ncbi:DUF3329 domain-containing protein [Rhizobium sp. L1K21]|uniref:DUF3329 domain-containing protein n=1 Tax=Rhizobium sp. L1K21 TaxID=2954933 RepID=UPI00209323E7|nr:DUF3329 domain-containing protein [Rhizobium sp. L1K21]MCO6188253.1 DUF3329 domain-containing protein [Rhizobium sp. L1K21]